MCAKKSQLELYLDEPRISRDEILDILAYWRGHQFRYPELASMAHDILCIPVSTVASESTFSVSGRVIDQYWSSLEVDVVEALICTRDWLYGEQGNLICICIRFLSLIVYGTMLIDFNTFICLYRPCKNEVGRIDRGHDEFGN